MGRCGRSRPPSARRCRCWRAAPPCGSCSPAWSIGSTSARRWCGARIRWNISASCGSTRPSAACAITGSTNETAGSQVVSEPHVVIHTDGACSGNPGPGGFGAILAFGDRVKELKGGEPHTTNNRMELMAAIAAFEALKRPCLVDLHTDSQYLRNGILTWIHGWKKNGWRTADKKPVKNVDLWKRLDEALANHDIRWHWVKGHAGHAQNERADELARMGIIAARAGAIGSMKTQ